VKSLPKKKNGKLEELNINNMEHKYNPKGAAKPFVALAGANFFGADER
jgi:hypothetical protein